MNDSDTADIFDDDGDELFEDRSRRMRRLAWAVAGAVCLFFAALLAIRTVGCGSQDYSNEVAAPVTFTPLPDPGTIQEVEEKNGRPTILTLDTKSLKTP